MSEFFNLFNDVIQAVMVIFGTAVFLYNVGRTWRVRVTRAFSTLVAFVVVVYLTELLVSRTIVESTEIWLRLAWVGISMVPAAQYHLSDALLSATGSPSRRRRWIARGGYVVSGGFLVLALWSHVIVGPPTEIKGGVYLQAGTFFPLFALYYWLVTIAGIYNVWRARGQCRTRTTRRRMTITLYAFLAAPLGVFPYSLINEGLNPEVTFGLWPVLILGNLIVGLMFGLLTAHLIYFGANSPDRVIRVRLYKFMARVPLAGTMVLLVYVLVNRGSDLLGLETDTALGFALVATVMLVEWAVHAYKRPLERFFHLNDDPELRLIQSLGERLLTTRDLRDFLESVLAVTCEVVQTDTAFVVVTTTDGARLEAVVGPLTDVDVTLKDTDLRRLAQTGLQNGNGQVHNDVLPVQDGFILWQNYWLRPLYTQRKDQMLGLFGVLARAERPNFSAAENELLERLFDRARIALEDRFLQQDVFAAVEKLLPEITALQRQNQQAAFGGLPVLTASEEQLEATLIEDPAFNSMVRDALSHYWGGPKLTESPLLRLQVVQRAMQEHDNNPITTLRTVLNQAIELQRPEGERNLSKTEWVLYNILELKFVQGKRVRDVARRLSMSESDLYRKQRVAIENVARTIAFMETAATQEEVTKSPS